MKKLVNFATALTAVFVLSVQGFAIAPALANFPAAATDERGIPTLAPMLEKTPPG